jgi:hypothetical protein
MELAIFIKTAGNNPSVRKQHGTAPQPAAHDWGLTFPLEPSVGGIAPKTGSLRQELGSFLPVFHLERFE